MSTSYPRELLQLPFREPVLAQLLLRLTGVDHVRRGERYGLGAVVAVTMGAAT